MAAKHPVGKIQGLASGSVEVWLIAIVLNGKRLELSVNCLVQPYLLDLFDDRLDVSGEFFTHFR